MENDNNAALNIENKPEDLKPVKPASVKKRNRIIALAMAAVIAATGIGVGSWAIWGRGKKDDGPSQDGHGNITVTPGIHNLSDIEDGRVVTRYKIVIPAGADGKTKFAANELATLFDNAAGARPQVITDEVAENAGEYYLSIGKTKQMQEHNFDSSYARLRDGGFSLQTVDTAAYMFGTAGTGNINSVYGFCGYTFGYEFFASDEYFIRREVGTKLPVFNGFERPDFDGFAPMYGEMNADASLVYRMRATEYYDTWIGVLYGHTYYKLLPPETYGHNTDWYSPKKDKDGRPENLCLTRSPAMKEEFIRRVKETIEGDPARNYMMLGQEDNFGFCNCATCDAQIKKYGTASAVAMRFTNEVVREVNAWLKAEHPERDITFVTFAYNETKAPPVTFNGATGKYVPVDPSVVAEDNLSVMFVISFVDYFKPYSEDDTVMRMLNGWNSITKNLTIWQYCTNFDNYMEPFANWGTMAPNYKLLKQYGTSYIVEQGSYGSATSSFSEMRMYIQSSLAWNTDLNTGELIEKFMRAYYKDAHQKVKEYFDLVLNHTAALISDKGLIVRSGSSEIMNQQNWSNMTLTRMENLLNEALDSIAYLKAENLDLYQTLSRRILKQTITPRYFKLKFYPPSDEAVEAAQYEILKNDALSFGIIGTSEGGGW